MRRLLLIFGALAGMALAAVGGVTTVDAIGSFSDVRIEDTRTPIPGAREVKLDAGKYVLFYEVDDESVSHLDGGPFPVPALDVTVRRAEKGPALDLDDYSGDFNVSSGGRAAQAAATLEAPEDGRYEIAARTGARASAPAVVLGRPITGRILRLIAGLAGIVAGLGIVALVAALAIGLAVRGSKSAG